MSLPGQTEIVLVEAIDAVLPQTQCRQCGYAGCRPYAAAVASGLADINRCPPGGDRGVRAMAALTGLAVKPLDPECGAPRPRSVAVIAEPLCIGCTLCIQACPVDAIVGAAKLMHTVIGAVCTGCELCVPPCPVDCISLVPMDELEPKAAQAAAARSRRRHEARNARLERDRRERAERPRTPHAPDPEARKRQTVERALERARARLLSREP